MPRHTTTSVTAADAARSLLRVARDLADVLAHPLHGESLLLLQNFCWC